VRLPKNKNNSDETIYTVLQPDLYVVCDLTKLDDRGCLGAPDLVIEITSPKTARRDLKDKYQIYEQHGVREYWIVNPSDENVLTFVLDANGKFQLAGLYAGDDKIPVHIFDGDLQIDLTEVFVGS
jgi:Uma2 family endonuclease